MPKIAVRLTVAILGVLLVVPCGDSQDFSSSATQFAVKIESRVEAGAAALIVRNRSSLDEATVEAIRSEIQRQLKSRGWSIKKTGEAESSIEVTLSENISSYVWTAEIVKGETKQIVLLEVSRPK